ncbi:hypothetical protein [Nonomuraea sp. NPDC050643]|uniref:hypothetical protein n=1 Tax=Nonomuraea sp. NPDC050643 TaxID=3155660 RepID=UPI0033EE77C3
MSSESFRVARPSRLSFRLLGAICRVTPCELRTKGGNKGNNGRRSPMSRSGRKDQPIDRESGPVPVFVDDLRRLRGGRSLQEIGRRMSYHSSTVSRRLTPNVLPPLDFVRAYVVACGEDPEPWERRWRELADAEPPPPPPRRTGRARLVAAIVAASLAAVAVAGAGLWWLATRESGPVNAAGGESPPAVSAVNGFTWDVKRMLMNVESRQWTQAAGGDIEIWANIPCSPGMTEFFVALRPEGETARFRCGSWQHHEWTAVPAGRHHFYLWKENDGSAVSGSGVLRSSTEIVQIPKTPVP